MTLGLAARKASAVRDVVPAAGPAPAWIADPSGELSPHKAAHNEHLAGKRANAEKKVLAARRRNLCAGEISFACCGLNASGTRGKLAHALCSGGPRAYDFGQLAETTGVDVIAEDVEYVMRAFAFRADLVGLTVTAANSSSEGKALELRFASVVGAG
jgi:hypothetical protein